MVSPQIQTEEELCNPISREWTVEDIGRMLTIHVAKDAERDKKMNDVYKALFLGNSKPSLVFQIETNTRWIATVNKFIWIIVGAVILQLVAAVFSFLALVYALLTRL